MARIGNFGAVAIDAAGEGRIIPLTTIDALALPGCDFLKIDVEGMEREVVEGAADTIRRFRPRIYVENDRAEKSAALTECLLALDYRLYWRLPPLFEPDNFFDDRENIFPTVVAINMLCIPRSGPLSIVVKGLAEITSKDADWRAPF
jgi:hypothetical protein